MTVAEVDKGQHGDSVDRNALRRAADGATREHTVSEPRAARDPCRRGRQDQVCRSAAGLGYPVLRGRTSSVAALLQPSRKRRLLFSNVGKLAARENCSAHEPLLTVAAAYTAGRRTPCWICGRRRSTRPSRGSWSAASCARRAAAGRLRISGTSTCASPVLLDSCACHCLGQMCWPSSKQRRCSVCKDAVLCSNSTATS